MREGDGGEDWRQLSTQKVIAEHVRRECELDAIDALVTIELHRAGIVDEHVQAWIPAAQLSREIANRALARGIELHDDGRTAAGTAGDLLCDLLALRCVPAGQDQIRALIGKRQRDLLPDTRRRTGDDDSLA